MTWFTQYVAFHSHQRFCTLLEILWYKVIPIACPHRIRVQILNLSTKAISRPVYKMFYSKKIEKIGQKRSFHANKTCNFIQPIYLNAVCFCFLSLKYIQFIFLQQNKNSLFHNVKNMIIWIYGSVYTAKRRQELIKFIYKRSWMPLLQALSLNWTVILRPRVSGESSSMDPLMGW